MNFDLAVEQKLLKDSVRKFFSKESDAAALHQGLVPARCLDGRSQLPGTEDR
jgi:hypothetical protein